MSSVWFLLILLPVLGGAERFNCKTRILGAYYPDTKSGCKAFHVCVRVAGGGVRDFRFYCPPGTLFHQEAQTCTDWGDDDPLACPANIYDGQFDLYRIGSGFDTKKFSSGNREDETENALQQAETGDRRLPHNTVGNNAPASDLRAAHSSDFFTGRRDRGRDEPIQPQQGPPAPQSPVSLAPQSSAVQPVPIILQAPPASPRQSFRRPTTPKTITTKFTIPPSPPTQSSNPPQYETSKRKITRKRPVSTQNKINPTTFAPYVPSEQVHSERPQQNFNRRVSFQSRQTTLNLPPQFKEYKDEYVEVSRVTPKTNKFHSNELTSSSFPQQSTSTKNNKKEGLVEVYNYEDLSTPGLTAQKDYHPFNVKNSFNVIDIPRESNLERNKNGNGNFNQRLKTTTTEEYSAIRDSTTPPYKNFNSVSYESEKQSFVTQYKNNHYRNPTLTTPTTSTTLRSDHLNNLNTVAYNTNIAFNVPANNFAESEEDDGQYRPPQGEDDGQYRPELYEKELLSGAHSINIAASGNRLLQNKKSFSKTLKVTTQTAAPQPFQPLPSSNLPAHTTRESDTYTTTQSPQTINTQRTFDFYQTYTTTSRPNDFTEQNFANNVSTRPTTSAPRIPEKRPRRPQGRPSTKALATVPPQPTTRSQPFIKPLNNKEDNSYDYAYYDSDPGFSEYDHNLEFGKTKRKA